MSIPLHSPAPRRLTVLALGIVVSVVALLPWWHNRAYLRDFYDYGIFINVNARLAEGQHPYVDFTTPAQSAAFLLNRAAEGGSGTYLGLTRGAAALIVVGGLALTFLLARRFNPWVAALLALAIVTGSASQHTIIFYNPLGVLATALVVWAFAVAPLLRRETLGWHVVAAAGLVLGGVNKINFHLLACAMAAGWTIYAWLAQKPGATRVMLTFAFIGLFGLILPVSLEIAWTGAGWQNWFYNVIELPLSARGARISYLFSPQLYLQTLHVYYGELRVPQVGLIGVLMPLFATIAALRAAGAARRGWRGALIVLAGVLATFASSALLLTNNEIAYLTFAASLAIAVGLWLGFGLEARGPWFLAGVVLPAAILAAAGWESAWRGQRSQFGHDRTPREEYALGEDAGHDFPYIRGLHLPPATVTSLRDLADWRRALPGDEAGRVFYGPGTEWLEHVWSAPKVPGLPLIAAAFDGPRENKLLTRDVIGGTTFRHLIVLEAWDHWNPPVEDLLRRTTLKQRIGTTLMVYTKLRPGTVSSRPLDFLSSGFDSNVDGSRLTSLLPRQTLPDGRGYLGLDRGTGRVDAGTPCRRMSAEYVLARVPGDHGGPLVANLAIHANLSGSLLPRWHESVTLPAGTDELVVRTEAIDGSGLPLTFTVEVPQEASGRLRAGWRGWQLIDTVDSDSIPPLLQAGSGSLVPARGATGRTWLPAALDQAEVYTRRATIEHDALILPAGGEAWVKLDGLYTDVRIALRLDGKPDGTAPRAQVVYYKGGRLERFAAESIPAEGVSRINAWSPENGGWIGILADPDPGVPPFSVKIESATRH